MNLSGELELKQLTIRAKLSLVIGIFLIFDPIHKLSNVGEQFFPIAIFILLPTLIFLIKYLIEDIQLTRKKDRPWTSIFRLGKDEFVRETELKAAYFTLSVIAFCFGFLYSQMDDMPVENIKLAIHSIIAVSCFAQAGSIFWQTRPEKDEE